MTLPRRSIRRVEININPVEGLKLSMSTDGYKNLDVEININPVEGLKLGECCRQRRVARSKSTSTQSRD